MNKNKGFVGIGLIVAIVLGAAVVGGGAYYLGKNNNNKGDSITPSQYYSTDEYKINNPQANCKRNSPSAIKLISPNGGEEYSAGQKITVKWESCNVDKDSISIILLKQGSSKMYTQREGLNDYAGFTLGGVDPNKGIADDGVHEITLPLSSDSNLVSGKHYYISISATGDVTKIGSGYSPRDYSDDLFTINSGIKASSEESTSEFFKHQPGAIKSIKADGTNKWIFAIDLLTPNSGWIPGVNDRYLNQNTKIRNLNVTSSTKTYGCVSGPDGGGPNLSTVPNVNTVNYVSEVQKNITEAKSGIKYRVDGKEVMTDWQTLGFDINGSNISAIYNICLP